MARLTPKLEILRALFAHSGNRCAFPECSHPLINEKNNFIAQICHIEAAEKGGERYNPAQTDEERRGYNNLIILCYRHHIETNDIDEYTVARLIAIKKEHEKNYKEFPFNIEENTLNSIAQSFKEYYIDVEEFIKDKHIDYDKRVHIDFQSSFFIIADQIRIFLDHINNYHDYLREYDRKNGRINWEILNLGLNNCMTEVSVKLDQLELFYLEKYITLNEKDSEAIKRLQCLKESFKAIAIKVRYTD